MTETRIRCSGKARLHRSHIYHPSQEPLLMQARWTLDKGCRPYVTEQREVGPWMLVGQQELEAAK